MCTVTLQALRPDAADAVTRVHLAARGAYYAAGQPEAVQPEGVEPESVRPDTVTQSAEYTELWRSRLGREDWRLTGAFGGGELLGFTAVQVPAAPTQEVPPDDVAQHSAAEHALHLVALYVHPDHWDLGIGTLLYDAFEKDWAAGGYPRAELDVWSLNHRARRFYTRRGWLDDGRVRPAHEGTDYLGMVLRRHPPA
ncbi:GNAT family N-acetyltransferase [Cryobacterium sp. SO2]|uniref:GNAT family N-acetyltransferase n=1 Tax=Cryobacterium sp. SO2 TaxID=1897060 RepID=UPI00223E4654|nr:GNAT family N-acetyltransferase [Cryobacterium sp. SO2]WEO75768.1 GNAT family N-acetyltransferase [Cryobacterium sp. SO2]